MMDQTADFYSRPSYNYRGAGGFPIFAGSRRQRGGGIFGSLKSFFTPIAKSVGKRLIKQGVALASDVVKDVMTGKNIKSALLTHGKARAKNIGKLVASEGLSAVGNLIGNSKKSKGAKRLKRKGAGRRVRKKRRRQRVSRKRASRKRRAKRSSSYKPKAKRRRITANF